MSRYDELKKQYPELSLSILDIFVLMDKTKTYKYLPLLCKLFKKHLDVCTSNNKSDEQHQLIESRTALASLGIDTRSISNNQVVAIESLTQIFNRGSFEIMGQFIDNMELGLIENKDITSYSSFDEIRDAVSLSNLKLINKKLEKYVIKEFENDTWLVIRPLTFESSSKYGSSTKWCTTSKENKYYFHKYWNNGILIYVINKKTGYKFAGYKALEYSDEVSFWNAEDNRVDFLSLNIDDYIFSVLKNIFSSGKTNKDLSNEEIVSIVLNECQVTEVKGVVLEQTHPAATININ